MASVRRVRYFIYLKDVFVLAVMAFGGPQAHIAMLFDRMVKKRGYLSEDDLIELHALCQILPGPTSTQTITAIGFKIGGPNLAYLTLLVWVLPAASVMTAIGILITQFQAKGIDLSFTKYILPMAVGFISYAAYMISNKVVKSRIGISLMVVSAVVAFFTSTYFGNQWWAPYTFPLLLIGGGLVTALNFKKHPPIEENKKLTIQWSNFILFLSVGMVAFIAGSATSFRSLQLFESFYRNGSLIFGGGQVLIPLLQAEFVDYKEWFSADEFLAGIGFAQAMPGPVFSLSGYIGAISMNGHGISQQVIGSLFSIAGIFLPGTFLIFFVIRFWDQLKKYRVIRASMEGVNAVSSGLVTAAAIILFQPLDTALNTGIGLANTSLVIGTFCLLLFTRIPSPFIILGGIALGFIF